MMDVVLIFFAILGAALVVAVVIQFLVKLEAHRGMGRCPDCGHKLCPVCHDERCRSGK